MATTKEKFQIRISEEDPTVICAICDALNSLANPENKNGFIFNLKDDRLVISVYRCRNSFSSFEVSFKTISLEVEEILAINALFRKCILAFSYNSSEKILIITLESLYAFNSEEFHTENTLISAGHSERVSCILSLRKPFPMLKYIIKLLNIVKMSKILTINQHQFSVSSIGRNITLCLRVHVIRPNGSMNIPAFCSKFNYLCALKLVDFSFDVLTLNPEAPELLQINVFLPNEDDPRREKYNETIELLNSISSFK